MKTEIASVLMLGDDGHGRPEESQKTPPFILSGVLGALVLVVSM